VNLIKFYRKRLDANQGTLYKRFKETVDKALEDQEHVKEFHAFEVMKPVGCQCIMETLSDLTYKHMKELKLYKTQIGDEGVKYIA